MIYTRSGDNGETGLRGGPRVPKDNLRVEACGSVDELNTTLGVCLSFLDSNELNVLIQRIQRELLVLGSELATPPSAGRGAQGMKLSIRSTQVDDVEKQIDRFEADLNPLKEFIVPGGSPAAAHLHHARAVCRRAERRTVALNRSDPVSLNTLKYLNRLSDLLFVLARWTNKQAGVDDLRWEKDRLPTEHNLFVETPARWWVPPL